MMMMMMMFCCWKSSLHRSGAILSSLSPLSLISLPLSIISIYQSRNINSHTCFIAPLYSQLAKELFPRIQAAYSGSQLLLHPLHSLLLPLPLLHRLLPLSSYLSLLTNTHTNRSTLFSPLTLSLLLPLVQLAPYYGTTAEVRASLERQSSSAPPLFSLSCTYLIFLTYIFALAPFFFSYISLSFLSPFSPPLFYRS